MGLLYCLHNNLVSKWKRKKTSDFELTNIEIDGTAKDWDVVIAKLYTKLLLVIYSFLYRNIEKK